MRIPNQPRQHRKSRRNSERVENRGGMINVNKKQFERQTDVLEENANLLLFLVFWWKGVELGFENHTLRSSRWFTLISLFVYYI